MLSIDEDELITESQDFYNDVVQGLTKYPKELSSKYFYDQTGDRLFEAIMKSPDYYLSRCEMEIFTCRAEEIVGCLTIQNSDFEVIELGPGNCVKTIHLLRALGAANVSFKYIPIDISENVICDLRSFLPTQLPDLEFDGLIGDYLDTLASHCLLSRKRKIVMCLGGNIGNMTIEASRQFIKRLRSYLLPGDQCIIGFDLIKNPAVINRAYDDRQGITRAFNLNLLVRINRELEADFKIDLFDHYCSYDPLTGAAKSYLVCLADSVVHFPGAPGTRISFEKNECIWTEISQKYTREQVYQLAVGSGFVQNAEILDSKAWFVDAIWTAV